MTYAEIERVERGNLALGRGGCLSEKQVLRQSVRPPVDTGATVLSFPISVREGLHLTTPGESEAESADGSVVRPEVVVPMAVRFQSSKTIVGAVVNPSLKEVPLRLLPRERDGCVGGSAVGGTPPEIAHMSWKHSQQTQDERWDNRGVFTLG